MIETRIAGIPCLIQIETLNIVPPWKGSASTAPSDLDYHGYTEIEFTVCDRKGRPADWLWKKMTADEEREIEELILTHHLD